MTWLATEIVCNNGILQTNLGIVQRFCLWYYVTWKNRRTAVSRGQGTLLEIQVIQTAISRH